MYDFDIDIYHISKLWFSICIKNTRVPGQCQGMEGKTRSIFRYIESSICSIYRHYRYGIQTLLPGTPGVKKPMYIIPTTKSTSEYHQLSNQASSITYNTSSVQQYTSKYTYCGQVSMLLSAQVSYIENLTLGSSDASPVPSPFRHFFCTLFSVSSFKRGFNLGVET